MFAIHNLTLKDMVNNVLPSSLPLSSEQLDSTRVLLLENGKDVFINAGKTVSANVLQQLFGVQSMDDISDQFLLQEYGNDLSRKLNEIRHQRCSYTCPPCKWMQSTSNLIIKDMFIQ